MFAKGTFHFPLSQVKTNAEPPDASKVPCCFSGIEATVPPRYMACLPSTAAGNGLVDTKQQATTTHKALFMGIASRIFLKAKWPLPSPSEERPPMGRLVRDSSGRNLRG